MKTNLRNTILPATVGILSIMGTLVARAANDTWSGGGNPNFNWNVAGNWNTLPAASGDSLFFAGSTGLSNTNNFSSYSFNGVTINSGAGSFVLTGNSFSLNGGITNSATNPQLINNAVALAANGTIKVGSGGSLTNAGVISGAFTLTKVGTGLLNLQGASTFSGAFSSSQGTVQVSAIGLSGTAGPLGAAPNGIATGTGSACPINLTGNNGPTLQYIGPGETTDRSIFMDAQNGYTVTLDASGTGALVFMSGVTNIFEHGGNATPGSDVLILTGSNPSTNTLAGDIKDNLGNNTSLSIYKTGVGTWCLTGVNHMHSLVWVQQGLLMFNTISNAGTACALGNGAASYAANAQIALGNGANSGTLQYTGSATNSTTRQFGLYGNGTISAGTNGGCLLLNGSITNLTGTAYALTLAGGATNLVGGVISDHVGVATTSLIVSNTGIWALTNANTFSGTTTVNTGTLALGSTGSINNTPSINIAAGATLDVSAIASYTLSGSTALSAAGTGSPATINGASGGTVNLGSQPITLTYDGSDPALTISQGALQLNGNGFTVNKATALAVGTYTMIAQSSGSITGTGTYSVAGTAIGAGTTGSISVSGGNVVLTIQNVTTTTLALSAGSNPSAYGAALTFQTTVSPAPANGETITFMDGTTTIGTGNTTGGVATLSTGTLAAGPHSLTAAYPGDASNFSSTSSVLTQNVNSTPLTITANNTNQTYNGAAFSGGNGVTYAGFVNSQTNTVLAGTLTYGGTAQGATSVGAYTIIPSGLTNASGTNYATSYVNGTLTISQAGTVVGASSSENPSGYKDSVSFQATLPVYATGNVVFSSTNGPISTNSVSAGVATSLSVTNLPRGTNGITVAYLGDANYLGSTNGTLLQVVTNHPPVAGGMIVTRTAGLRLLIALANVATNWSDPDGDTVTLTDLNLVTTNGANLMSNSAWILYTNSPNVADQISYGISDGLGGTNIGYINIVIQSSVTGTNSITGYTFGSTSNVLTAYGIPGYNYILERATNLVPAIWVDVTTNTAATNGLINAADTFWDLGGIPPSSAFYQLKWQP